MKLTQDELFSIFKSENFLRVCAGFNTLANVLHNLQKTKESNSILRNEKDFSKFILFNFAFMQ